MPYITCPDGKTYSRYDSNTEVKTCISNQKSAYQAKHAACMKDTICKENYDFNSNLALGISITFVIFTIILIFKLTSLDTNKTVKYYA